MSPKAPIGIDKNTKIYMIYRQIDSFSRGGADHACL